MPQIIGFIGVIGSGKNYQQDLLVKRGFIALNFKDELVAMAQDLVGFPIQDDYELFKELVVGFNRPGANLVDNYPKEKMFQINKECLEYFPKAMTGRRLLQRLGTNVMRKRDPDYWVNAWSKKAEEYLRGGYSVAVNDVRFGNEIKAIKHFNCMSFAPIETKIIFCNYKSDRYDATSIHPSETLAQKLLSLGLKDGDEVSLHQVENLAKTTPH